MQLSTFLPYFLIISAFLFDTCFMHIFQEPLFQATIVLYFKYFYQATQLSVLFFNLFFISVESFMWYDRFGVQLSYIIPLTFIAAHIQKKVTLHAQQPYILLGLSLTAQWYLLHPFLVAFPAHHWYTIGKIIANILLMMILL